MGTKSRRTKYLLLTAIVTAFHLAACPLPGFWGRGGLLEGGTVVPGWALVLGLPPLCCISWTSLAALFISAKWLWEDRLRRAFILACINVLPAATWFAACEPGRFELRVGYYVWFAGIVVWAVGVGWLRWTVTAKKPSSPKSFDVMDDL
jgi:hypothetical protein